MSELGDFFRQNLAQTSDAPLGLEILCAEGSWLVASDGRRYLDFIAGIGVSALGHGNPEVLDAIAAQARRHLHVMVYGEYVIESQVKLARRLVELLTPPLERVYFTNSGTEAVECALKVARKFTGRAGFVAFDGAYHGDTMGALALAGNRAMREPFGALPGPVTHLPFNDAGALEKIDSSVAAVIVEPVQGVGGAFDLGAPFLEALRLRCQQVGALLIFDEVQCGMGRVGEAFAAKLYGVQPDMITTAKALGAGFPCAALLMSPRVSAAVKLDALGTTFGGGPMACAVIEAVIEAIESEHLLARVRSVAALIRSRCLVGPVTAHQGAGLLVGLRTTMPAKQVHAALLERGILAGTSADPNILRLLPPFVLEAAHVELLRDALLDIGA